MINDEKSNQKHILTIYTCFCYSKLHVLFSFTAVVVDRFRFRAAVRAAVVGSTRVILCVVVVARTVYL